MKGEIKEKIITAVTAKKPLKDIAQKIFMTERQLRLLLTGWGVEIPKKRSFEKRQIPERQALMVQYSRLKSTSELAKFYDVSTGTINRWLRQLKIPMRKMKMSDGDKKRYLEEHLDKLENVNL